MKYAGIIFLRIFISLYFINSKQHVKLLFMLLRSLYQTSNCLHMIENFIKIYILIIVLIF